MPSLGAMLSEDLDEAVAEAKERQREIDELKAENAYLRQELRGLKKKLNKVIPLFKVSFESEYAMHVEMLDDDGKYWDFLKMQIDNESCSDDVYQVFLEVLNVFKQHGY